MSGNGNRWEKFRTTLQALPVTGRHTCHCPSCKREVPPRMFACKPCWYALPKKMRDSIWSEYVSGQEVRKDPSDAYLEAASAAVEYLRERHSHSL